MKHYSCPRHAQRGALMLEVVITMVIVVVGLWGLASVQARLQGSETESYQRAQALLLVNDMANRISTNRTGAATYVTTASSPLGAGMTCPTTTSTRQQIDSGEWCEELKGAGEQTVTNSKVGTLIGGRGCVEDLGSGQYMITVAWQGLTPISAPPSSVACGLNQYNGASGTQCVSDLCRRAITTRVTIATL